MRLVIFGASGKTGQELVKQSLGKGHHITAFVREPSKLNITHLNLSIVKGNVTDYPLVEATIKGNDSIFSTLGAASPFKYDQSVTDGIRNIVKAMEATGVGRLIYMSAINVKESRRYAGPLIAILGTTLLRTETAGHEARENIINKSHLAWTIVRAAGLNNGKHTGLYRSGEKIKANGITAGISRADVADFMLNQLTDTHYVRKSPMVMY